MLFFLLSPALLSLTDTGSFSREIYCLFLLIFLNIFFMNCVYMKCQKFLLYLARLPFFKHRVHSKRTFRLSQCTFVGIFFFPKGIIPWLANHLSSAGTQRASEILCSHIFLNYPSSLSCSFSPCNRKKVAF